MSKRICEHAAHLVGREAERLRYVSRCEGQNLGLPLVHHIVKDDSRHYCEESRGGGQQVLGQLSRLSRAPCVLAGKRMAGQQQSFRVHASWHPDVYVSQSAASQDAPAAH